MMKFCDCDKDGYCLRYNREMGGRLRDICRGVNVDLGTAAAFREQWSREACSTYDGPPTPLLLKTDQAPGDTVAMTAAIYSLHQAYPGAYTTAVESYWPEVFAHNPDVVDAESIPDALPLQMHYPAIHQSNQRGIHFMQGWCEFLGMALGIPLPLLTNTPRLYFDTSTPLTEDFWLVCAGGKRDFTNKQWHSYQEVVNLLAGKVRFVQVGGAKPPVAWSTSTTGTQEDSHLRLDGVEDMVGKTTLRHLFNLVRKARGVLCGVSLLMHVAAALEKPAVVIAGGREPVQWNAYPQQHYLHTVGMLPCSDPQGHTGGACWRARVVPLGDGTFLDRDTCLYPVNGVPKCMRVITPTSVADLILRINSTGAGNVV